TQTQPTRAMAPTPASSTAMPVALVALLALQLAPSARAGAVFEVREDVPTDPANLKFVFGGGAQTTTFPGAGTIRRSAGAGAGAFFASSAIPLAIFSVNRCCAVAVHVHP
ncbi:hypothetical protein, partial [Klebsiella pneumoniae]|uniref:hypothetical protein n=1 Tax=Klebsiella pneumoniae TaxID=573 RepID=UPI0025A0256D